MSANLVHAGSYGQMDQTIMGYVEIVRGDKITSFVGGHEYVRKEPICDECLKPKPSGGGKTIRIHHTDEESVMWFCAECLEKNLAQ